MFQLHYALSCLVRGTCQQLRQPLTAVSRTVAVLRPLSTTTARLQEAETEPVGEDAPAMPAVQSKGFSRCPPIPGQDSALRWGGKKFEDLPIVHVKSTYNNTHIQVTDKVGKSMVRTSCGTEGFRNIKKTSTIASQTAGISAASKAVDKGVTYARVVVKGLGPGRMSAIKGLTMGGLQIVSITDGTPIPHNGCKPRKPRRL